MAPAGQLSTLSQKDKMSDHNGAASIYPMLPEAETLIADKGYDSDAFREALAGRRITPCIPREPSAGSAKYRNTLYRQPHRVENAFAKLKDRRLSQCVTTAAPTHSSALSASP
jgi:transposase